MWTLDHHNHMWVFLKLLSKDVGMSFYAVALRILFIEIKSNLQDGKPVQHKTPCTYTYTLINNCSSITMQQCFKSLSAKFGETEILSWTEPELMSWTEFIFGMNLNPLLFERGPSNTYQFYLLSPIRVYCKWWNFSGIINLQNWTFNQSQH